MSKVDAELPAAPAAAKRLFGARLSEAEAYVSLLALAGVQRGLLGPREVPRLWDRHILNSAVVAELIGQRCRVVDLGSGAGLPGIAIAILRPDLEVVLLEPLLRRWRFLVEATELLHRDDIVVVRGRAEEMAGQLSADVVVARAVAPLDRLSRWALPLLRPGGELLAIKGESAAQELVSADTTLQRLGAAEFDLVRVGESVVQPPTTVVRVRVGRHQQSV